MNTLPPETYFLMGLVFGVVLCVLVSALHEWDRRRDREKP